jgi:hypothetical protein
MANTNPSYTDLANDAIVAWKANDMAAFYAAFRSVHVTQKGNVVGGVV